MADTVIDLVQARAVRQQLTAESEQRKLEEAARLVVEAAELVGLRSVNGLCRALGWRLG